jgi:hypothetical protein
MEMSGCMPKPNNPTANKWNRDRLKRIEKLKPRIEELQKEGLSGLKIARELDLPRSTVCSYIKELNERS